jgi:GTPase SAR1 family protein
MWINRLLQIKQFVRYLRTSYHLVERTMSVTSLVKQQNAIGTQSNHLKLGIIGTANVGKSSLFNVLVRDERRVSPSENCLFRTTDPYVGIFTPEDLAIDYITRVLNVSAVPTSITVADTAGVVEGSFREVSPCESHACATRPWLH